jgi:hypothetical protein
MAQIGNPYVLVVAAEEVRKRGAAPPPPCRAGADSASARIAASDRIRPVGLIACEHVFA